MIKLLLGKCLFCDCQQITIRKNTNILVLNKLIMSNECKSKRDFSVIHLRKPAGAKAFCKSDLNKFLQGDIKFFYETKTFLSFE